MHRWVVGNFTVDRIQELVTGGAYPSRLFVDYDPELYRKFPELNDFAALDENGREPSGVYHSWLLRNGNDRIIIDTGSGNGKQRSDPDSAGFGMLATRYLEHLAECGVQPEQVTHVVNTHLHVDHCGWNTTLREAAWVPTFPNATYYFGQKEYDSWLPGGELFETQPDGHEVIADSVKPVVDSGQVLFVSEDDYVVPGLKVIAAPGHSVGHIALLLESIGEFALFTGDVMHRPAQIYDPNLNTRFCQDPETARNTRRKVLDMAVYHKALVFPAHFPWPHAGRVNLVDGRFTYTPEEPQ